MTKIKIKMNKSVCLGLSILKIEKDRYINFGMVTLDQIIKTMQNYVTWIHIVLFIILKMKISIKILLTKLKKDLIH